MIRLRELRKSKGWTQLQVQMKTGIDQSDLSKIERGSRYLSLDQCKMFALMYDTSMDYIVGLTDVKEPPPRAKSIDK